MFKYPKTKRLESAIIEEKLDGSNFSWEVTENGIVFYSRNKQLHYQNRKTHCGDNIDCERFYHPFVKYINVLDLEIPFKSGYVWYAEVLGQTATNYELTQNTHDNIFVFDIFSIEMQKMASRELLETVVQNYSGIGLKCIPLTTIDHRESQLNPNITREGVILRYDLPSGSVKIKHIEPQNSKKNSHFETWDLIVLK